MIVCGTDIAALATVLEQPSRARVRWYGVVLGRLGFGVLVYNRRSAA